jgi:hypothetical protein
MTRRRDRAITSLGFTCFHLEGRPGDYAPVEVLAAHPRLRPFVRVRR